MVCFLLQKLGKDEEQFVVDLKTGKVYKGMLILACDVSTPKSYGCYHTCLTSTFLHSMGSVLLVIDYFLVGYMKGSYEGKPDATFAFVDSDFVAVSTGKLNPQIAFIR